MSRLRSLLQCAVLCCFAVCGAWNQTPAPKKNSLPSNPVDVVEEFCKLDFNGEQLTTEGWRHMAHLFTWPDAPSWDDFTVVRKYKVLASTVSGDRAAITVEFERVGKVSDEPAFTSDVATEQVTFQVIHTVREWEVDADGGPKKIKPEWSWKIRSPQRNPHVSCEAAIKQVRSLSDTGQESIKTIDQVEAACKEK